MMDEEKLRELIDKTSVQLDAEVALLMRYVQIASAWQATSAAMDEEKLFMATAEVDALRGRVVGVMLRALAQGYKAQGAEGTGTQLEDLSARLWLSSLRFAREHNLSWASEE